MGSGILRSFFSSLAIEENLEGTKDFYRLSAAGSGPAAAASTAPCLVYAMRNAEHCAPSCPRLRHLLHCSGAALPPQRCLSHRPGSRLTCGRRQIRNTSFPSVGSEQHTNSSQGQSIRPEQDFSSSIRKWNHCGGAPFLLALQNASSAQKCKHAHTHQQQHICS